MFHPLNPIYEKYLSENNPHADRPKYKPKRVAVIFAPGCEEIEGITVVDVLRRTGIEVDMLSLDQKAIFVNGDHDIILGCDEEMARTDAYRMVKYDMVVFPGGDAGAHNLRNSRELEEYMVKRQEAGKWNAAICAAPIALSHYGLLKDATFTCYPGYEKEILADNPTAKFSEEMIVVDKEHKLITSRGPATSLAFAYKIAEVVGVNTEVLKELKKGMLYDFLSDHIQPSLQN